MNSVVLIGRLARNVSFNEGEKPVAKMTLAVDRQGREGADFISCVAFGKTAELCNKYLEKGSQVAVQGRITTGSYENKDGKKVYTTDVFVDRVKFLQKAGEKAEKPKDDIDIPEGFSRLDDDGDMPF